MVTSRYLMRSIWWTSLGILGVWSFAHIGWWAQCAAGALFFGKAVVPAFQLVGAINGESPVASFGRGYRIMALGYVTAACAIGVGALWRGSFAGFLVAYGAFSFAWIWLYAARQLARRQN